MKDVIIVQLFSFSITGFPRHYHVFLVFSLLLSIDSTLIKKRNFLKIYKEIQMGSGAKSYMRKGFLIYEEMRKYFTIYEEAVSHI